MVRSPLEMDVGQLTSEELVEHALALRTILCVGDAVHLSTNFADLAERAVDAIVQYTRYPSVALFRIDAPRERAELISFRGLSREVVETGRSLPLRGSLTGVAVRSRAVTTSADLASDQRIEPHVRQVLEAEGFSEVACVPILFRDEAIGSLNLIYRRAAKLTEHERSTLLAIGKTIGLAMQNRVAAEERQRLHTRLQRTQSLESLGVLAGGIAHDFNNLLAGILGSVSLAKRLPNLPERLPDLLELAEKSSLRAADLARQLLALSRGGAPMRQSTSDVVGVVHGAVENTARECEVACQVEAAGDIGLMIVDAAQLAQVVENLVRNAIQASTPGGAVLVRLERRERPAGPALRLIVRDRGCGIAADVIGRIFDPYFSTRENGSGLGLAITHAIVQRHGGQIDVESKPGEGTTFVVELPMLPGKEPPVQRSPRELPRGARVLLVDDEAGVRQTCLAMLCHLGLDAVAAASSDEAIAAFDRAQRDGVPFDGVILDLTMVGSESGVATLQRLRALDPRVRALVSSGYSDGAEHRDFERHGFAGTLPKPYTLQQLMAAMAELLN